MGTDYSSTWSMQATSPVASCTPPAPAMADFSMDADNRAYKMTSGKAVSTIHVNSFGMGTVNLRLGGVPTGVTATISQQSLLSGTVTITFTSSLAATAQNAPITIWGSSGSRVHSITFYVQVQPTQGTSVVTWATPQAITYGTPLGASQLNATLSVPGTCAYSPAVGTVLTPGTRTLTATCTPTDTYNYTTPSPVTVSLTVAKVPLTITAASLTLAYKSAVPTITPVYTGFVNGESSTSLSKAPSCSTTYNSSSTVGTPASSSCSGASAANYTIAYVPGTITIVPASQTITMGQTPASVAYGALPIALSATASSGLAVTFSGTAGVCYRFRYHADYRQCRNLYGDRQPGWKYELLRGDFGRPQHRGQPRQPHNFSIQPDRGVRISRPCHHGDVRRIREWRQQLVTHIRAHMQHGIYAHKPGRLFARDELLGRCVHKIHHDLRGGESNDNACIVGSHRNSGHLVSPGKLQRDATGDDF